MPEFFMPQLLIEELWFLAVMFDADPDNSAPDPRSGFQDLAPGSA